MIIGNKGKQSGITRAKTNIKYNTSPINKPNNKSNQTKQKSKKLSFITRYTTPNISISFY